MWGEQDGGNSRHGGIAQTLVALPSAATLDEDVGVVGGPHPVCEQHEAAEHHQDEIAGTHPSFQNGRPILDGQQREDHEAGVDEEELRRPASGACIPLPGTRQDRRPGGCLERVRGRDLGQHRYGNRRDGERDEREPEDGVEEPGHRRHRRREVRYSGYPPFGAGSRRPEAGSPY